ncbi:glycosyltransferase [Campylobacter lari]|nr:glycosyltransferase [Campylobacter lari]EAI4435858.1 glycosyltransferase [Campylobacter lari]EAI7247508.1 glycosyltransferase [Campylobacter lari]EAJ0337997.1 glycosyltransferase [Campylobacter lari]EAK0797863.1 glycosyltransferase [Campylobacter lari]
MLEIEQIRKKLQIYCKSTDSKDSIRFMRSYRNLTSREKEEDYNYLDDYIVKFSKIQHNTNQIKINDEFLNRFEILIPTYNRKEYIVQVIHEIKFVNENIHIRVSDNGSNDGTYDALKELTYKYPRLYISKNEKNMGFGFNLHKLLQECDKEFFCVTSDEDPVIVKYLVKAIRFCIDNKIDALRPLCIHYNKNECRIEYKTYTTEKQLKDIATFGYLPGCIFNTKTIQQFVKYYNRGDITGVYEFNIWYLIASIFGKSYFFNYPVQYHKFWAKKTFINPNDDVSLKNLKPYSHPSMRWEMLVAFTNILREIKKDTKDLMAIKKIEQIMDVFSNRAIGLLYNIAVSEFPNLKLKTGEGFIYKSTYQKLSTKLNAYEKEAIYKTVRCRIHNHLAYKLGQAMIVNSKSILGYIRMPFVLSYIKDKHKQEQKTYQEKIKKDPSLKLPPLESYPGYQEVLKERECLTYKLGEALMDADKTWYVGGYIRLLFKINRLKKDFKKGAR